MTGLIRAKSPPGDTRFVSKLHCYVAMKEQLSVAQALTLRVGKRAKEVLFFSRKPHDWTDWRKPDTKIPQIRV